MIYFYYDEGKSLTNYLDLISNERYKRAKRYLKDQDRRNCILGYLLLRYGILKEYNIEINNYKYSYNEFGKPYIKSLPDISFNISHSGKYIVCIIERNRIGIDIQEVVNGNFMGVADLVCSEIEKNKILHNFKPSKLFTKYWCLKESYIKAEGIGIDNAIKDLDFSNFRENAFTYKEYFFQIYEDKKYVLSVCSCKRINLNINKIKLTDFK